MIPITTGVIPFGLIMGTVTANAELDIFQSLGMNFFVFAGAAQLAVVDLMTQNTSSFVIIATGLIINLRMMLYSAALSPLVQHSKFLTKTLAAYCLTDQSYAVTIANEDKFNDRKETLKFYFGASLCMISVWHMSVCLGFVFGNFAPASISLDFAVPLSFAALTIPSLKDKNYIYVAYTTAALSILLKHFPYNLGLLVASLFGILLGAFLTRKKVADD